MLLLPIGIVNGNSETTLPFTCLTIPWTEIMHVTSNYPAGPADSTADYEMEGADGLLKIRGNGGRGH